MPHEPIVLRRMDPSRPTNCMPREQSVAFQKYSWHSSFCGVHCRSNSRHASADHSHAPIYVDHPLFNGAINDESPSNCLIAN